MKSRIEKINNSVIEKDTTGQEAAVPSESEVVTANQSEKMKEPRERAGTILKREREKQGLSLEIVHETTKIPLDALRAIEEGYTIRMLSPFYYSGFVKMYAHFLKIDASEVIDDYKTEELPEPIDPVIEDFELPKWITHLFTKERKQQIVVVSGALCALVLLFAVINFFTTRKSQPPAPKIAEKVEPVKKEIKKAAVIPIKKVRKEIPKIITPKKVPKVAPPQAPKAVVKPVTKSVVKPAAGIVPVAVIQNNINLTVRANQNSWLRVKTDGVVVFQSTLRMGAVEKWVADEDIEISGRNINQLEFELNGKMIGTLGRKDRNAKKVIVTKNGLSVKK